MIEKLILTQVSESGQSVTFIEPLEITYCLKDDPDYANIEFDFGMNYEILITNSWLDLDKIPNLKDKIKRIVTFDIIHAFFHPNQDPNYEPLHWAILGWLQDRVVLEEKD